MWKKNKVDVLAFHFLPVITNCPAKDNASQALPLLGCEALRSPVEVPCLTEGKQNNSSCKTAVNASIVVTYILTSSTNLTMPGPVLKYSKQRDIPDFGGGAYVGVVVVVIVVVEVCVLD